MNRFLKMEHISPMENYSAIEKYEIMKFSSKWVELEMIILNTFNFRSRKRHYMLSLICRSKFHIFCGMNLEHK